MTAPPLSAPPSARYRLRKRAEFACLFRQGKSVNGDFLRLRYLPNHLPHHRLGLAISKSHIKKAVQRNRLRRLLHEFFRREPPAAGDFFLQLTAPCAKSITANEVWGECRRLLAQTTKRRR